MIKQPKRKIHCRLFHRWSGWKQAYSYYSEFSDCSFVTYTNDCKDCCEQLVETLIEPDTEPKEKTMIGFLFRATVYLLATVGGVIGAYVNIFHGTLGGQ